MKKQLRKDLRFKGRVKNKRRYVFHWIKKNLILIFTIISVFISLFILFFMIITYNSPPNVCCEIDFVQRPDSIFQAQLYIWNDGGISAENVVFWAKKEQVFLYDTSGNLKKGCLNIFPHFPNLLPKIAPRQYLDEAGIKKNFFDHQLILTNLPSSTKSDNYIIIGPNVGRNMKELEKMKSAKTSLYRFKYIELDSTTNIKSYKTEILENIHVSYDGRNIKIQQGEIVSLSDIESGTYYFPSFGEFDTY